MHTRAHFQRKTLFRNVPLHRVHGQVHLKNISLRDSMQTQRIDKQPRHTMESAREKVPDDANMDFFATLAKLDCSTPPLECSSSAAPASGVRQDEPTEDGMPPPTFDSPHPRVSDVLREITWSTEKTWNTLLQAVQVLPRCGILDQGGSGKRHCCPGSNKTN